jgi:hypothetical protein
MNWHSKNSISFIWPKTVIADSSVDHIQYLNDVPLRTVRYSCRLSTADTTLLFTQSANSTNITVHILQCVTVMNQDTLQHFPHVPLQHQFHTQDCISQTVSKYISCHQFTFQRLKVGKRVRFTFNCLLSCKVPHVRVLKGVTSGREFSYRWWHLNFTLTWSPATMWPYDRPNN